MGVGLGLEKGGFREVVRHLETFGFGRHLECSMAVLFGSQTLRMNKCRSAVARTLQIQRPTSLKCVFLSASSALGGPTSLSNCACGHVETHQNI